MPRKKETQMKTLTPDWFGEAACGLGFEPTIPRAWKITLVDAGPGARRREGCYARREAVSRGAARAWIGLLRRAGCRKGLIASRQLQFAAATSGLANAQFELSLLLARELCRVDTRGAIAWGPKLPRLPSACVSEPRRAASQTVGGPSGRRLRTGTSARRGGELEAAARLPR